MTNIDEKTGEIGEIGETTGVETSSSKPLIEKTASLVLQGTNTHFEVFSFRDGKGKQFEMAMRRSLAAKPNQVMDALLDAGIADSPKPMLQEAVNRAVGSQAKQTGTLVIVGGWTPDCVGTRFIMSDRIIRRKATPKTKLTPPEERALWPCLDFNGKSTWNLVGKNGIAEGSSLTFSQRGDCGSWKKEVAKPAGTSSHMMLCISAAFAAPLLRVMEVSPFTLLLTGRTTGGKTSATLAASSVIGIGEELNFTTWDLTDAGLEELARIHSDMLLPIDDLATVGSVPKVIFELITTVPYRITAGARKGRMSTAMTAISGRPPPIKGVATIIITSCEKSLAQLATDAGRQLPDGIKVRFIEVPQATRKGGGLFDRCPHGKAPKNRLAVKARVEAITRACNQNHGAILAAWLEALVKKPNAAKNFVKKARKEFLAFVKFKATENLEHRHADRFSLLYAAGAYAIHLGLLPWKMRDLRAAIASCLQASRRTLNPPDLELQKGLKRLSKNLKDARQVVPWSDTANSADVSGFKKPTNGRAEYYIRGQRFRSWFASKSQQDRVLKFLLSGKYVAPGSDGKLTRQKDLTGNGRERCYILRLPATWDGFEARLSI